MGIIKKIVIIAAACLFAVNVPCGTSYNVVAVSDVTSKTDEEYIYRDSFTYYAGNVYENSHGSFCVNTVARKNGHITITIQGVDGQDVYAREFCRVTFDDSIIAEIGSVGYAGVSTYMQNFIGVSNIKQYKDNEVTYALFYNDYSSNMIGENLCEFDLYVNQEYLNNEINITVGGNTITLPFGECYQLDFNPTISRLRNEFMYQVQVNQELQAKIDYYEMTFGDIDGNNIVNAADAQILLKFYVDRLAGKTKTLRDYVNSEVIR